MPCHIMPRKICGQQMPNSPGGLSQVYPTDLFCLASVIVQVLLEDQHVTTFTVAELL